MMFWDTLKYMFHNGNIIDIGWFLVGTWTLLFFLGTLLFRTSKRK
jgi:hypothetical protein